MYGREYRGWGGVEGVNVFVLGGGGGEDCMCVGVKEREVRKPTEDGTMI